MSRLARLESHRFVGTRDTMLVYDCDDDADLRELNERIETDDLIAANQIQTFAPDTLLEARNRGFRKT